MHEKEEILVANAVGVPQLSEPRAEGLQLVFRYRHLDKRHEGGQWTRERWWARITREPQERHAAVKGCT